MTVTSRELLSVCLITKMRLLHLKARLGGLH